jgi:hypothetical protein
MQTKTQFIDRIESFLSQTGMSATRFGVESVGDPSFVFDLRKGRDCSLATAQKIMGFINSKSAPHAPSEGPMN